MYPDTLTETPDDKTTNQDDLQSDDLSVEHNCPGGPTLQADVQVINTEAEIDLNIDFEDVDAGGCVQLVPSQEQRINIVFKSRSKIIRHLCIVSENRMFEMFLDGHYSRSIQGDLMDDFEDTKIYTFAISLPQATKSVTLQIPDCREIWIFRIKAFLLESGKSLPVKCGNFDLESVNKLLENKHLSKNAQSFKNVFQMYQSTNSAPQNGHFPPFPAAGGQPEGGQFTKNPPNIQDLLCSPMMPFLMSAGKNLPQNLAADFLKSGQNVKSPPQGLDGFFGSPKLPCDPAHNGDTTKKHFDGEKTEESKIDVDTKHYIDTKFESIQNQFSKLHWDSSHEASGAKRKRSTNCGLDAETKKYIDDRFDNLKSDLMARIGAFENDTNNKLNLIIKKLEDKNS